MQNAGQIAEDYRRQGYAMVRGLFSPAEIATLRKAFDRERANALGHGRSFRHGNLYYRIGQATGQPPIPRMAQWPSYHDPDLEAVRRDPRWLPVLEPLIGRNLKQIINQLHWKPPGVANAEFAYHQDARFRRPANAYRNLATSYVQTGIAIDPHTVESGAMRVLPGSHQRRLAELEPAGRISSAAASEAMLRQAGLDPAALVDVELAPGDVALWHPYLVHGSGPNRSAQDRRFYLNGYVVAADCDRGEWAFRDGVPCPLGSHQALVHYEDLHRRPEPHYPEE